MYIYINLYYTNMLFTNKKLLAEDLKVDRRTINTMIKKWEVIEIYNNLGKKHYIHILTHIKDIL